MNEKSWKKINILLVFILTIFIISSLIFSLFIIPEKIQLLELSDSKLNLLNRLENWTKGDEYELHDPLYKEATSFLENEPSVKGSIVVNNAKNKGIRCAYVEIIVSENKYIKEAIGFNTIDEDMVFFEINSKYQISPVIGKNYSECFTDQIPELVNDYIIQEIIIVW